MRDKEQLYNHVEQRLQVYGEIFETYLSLERLPADMQHDVLANYIKTVLDDPGIKYQCQTEPLWMDLMGTSLLEFIRVLLPYYIEIEEIAQKEREYMDTFFLGDINMKR